MDEWRGLEEHLKRAGVKHFSARELSPRCGVPPAALWWNILPTVAIADLLRAKFGRIGVNSGYRDRIYNKKVGGAKDSYHIKFNALDLRSLEGHDVGEMALFLQLKGWKSLMGLGVYTGFIHIDTRVLMYGAEPWYHDYRSL